MPTYQYSVNTAWPGAGSPGANVWHFRAGDVPPEDVQDCVDVIQAFYSTIYTGSLLPTGSSCDGAEGAIDVETREVVPVTFSALTTTSADPEFAGPLQMIATKRTSSATRQGRGRIYIGPVAQGSLDADGTPTTSALQTLQTACTNLLQASSGLVDAAIGVYSPTYNLFRDLTAFQARNYFAVMRSRRD